MAPQIAGNDQLIACWTDRRRRVDVVLGQHAVDQGPPRGFSKVSLMASIRKTLRSLPKEAVKEILEWKGFPAQPFEDRSVIIRDLSNHFAFPLAYYREKRKIVVTTVLIPKQPHLPTPSGGIGRMSLIINVDGDNVTSALKIWDRFYENTPENRAIQYCPQK